MAISGQPAASYGFNNFQEIKSHSSILFNERLAISFYMLDMEKITLMTTYDITCMQKVKAILTQIYINIRTLLRNNPTMRCTLGIDTKDEGVYITDIMIDYINKLILYCDQTFYSQKRVYQIIDEMNKFEMTIKDILQYYSYFIRPDFRQKPGIEIATEKYKEIADRRTVEELRSLVGSKHKIDFDSLGQKQVEYFEEPEIDDSDIIGDAKLGRDHVETESEE
jgi:ribosomal protein L20A (L18A)